MKKLLAIILSVVMLFSVMATVYVSGNATYSYKTVQDFNGYAENEINRANNHLKNENGLKTKCNQSGSSYVTTTSLVSGDETIYYGYDNSMALKMWSNASGEYLEAYVPVTAEMRSGAVGFRVWFKNRSLSMSNLQLRFYAQKDGTEYVYKKAGYSVATGSEGYLELFFDDAEIAKHSQSPAYVNVDTSKVPDVSSYDMSEDLTYIGFMISCTSSGVISADNFEIISSDAPVEEDTTVPTEPVEESTTTATTTTTTTTTTTVAPSVPEGEAEDVDIIAGGEWVQGFWSNGAISTATDVHKKRAAYNVLLKVEPNTVYTIKTKTSDASANSINVKEHNANKEQIKNTNFQAYTLGANFTAKLTTSADTEYIGISFWNSYEGQKPADLYDTIKAALENGDISVSITHKVAVETTDLISTVDKASIRLGEVAGIRFHATVNADVNEVEEMGIIVAPKDIVGENITMYDNVAKIKYDHKTYELWNGNEIVGSIVGIKDANIARDFIARAYVVIDGVTYYAEDTTVRNIADIADAYIADANGGYAELDDDTKALVDIWASKND